ncbi:sigma factor-like helix-turn-helix DNA-binding protein [Nocardia sp. NPDC003482]
MKQWEPDWLSQVIAKIEAAPLRRPARTNTKVVQPRRLDRRLSVDTIAEIAAAYESGASTAELCKRYGLSKGGILKLLREADVKMRQQGMTEAQTRQAVLLYGEGHSYAEIARRLGKARSSVREAVLSQGVTRGPVSRKSSADRS